jgi:glucan phosphoethanolaminetransferase (alkaline phosphatase superfamily)
MNPLPFKGWVVYLWGFVLFVGFVLVNRFIAYKTFHGVVGVVTDHLSNLQEKELDEFLEMNKLLAVLASVIFGAIGAIVFHRYRDNVVPRNQWRRAVGCSVFSAISLGLSYTLYERISVMLRSHFFDLTNPLIVWTSSLQFWTFLLSVFLFADFTYRALRRE